MNAINETVKKIRKKGIEKFCLPKRRGRHGRDAVSFKEKDYLAGNTVDAGVIILKTRGCWWGRMSGCTMCGYIYDSSKEKRQEDIINAFDTSLEGLEGIEYLKIFNSGSFFDPGEMSTDTAKAIFQKAYGIKSIRRVQVESRPEFLKQDILEDVVRSIDKELEIGIGIETTSDYIREHCINKGFNLRDVKDAIKVLKNLNIKVKAYLLIKPLFLTEKEAIEDAIKSGIEVYGLGADRISFNPVNVQRGTLVEYLWKRREYRPPWLWSVVEVLKEVSSRVDVPVLSHPTAAGKIRGPHNCGECDNQVYRSIKEFSVTQDAEFLIDLDCRCRRKWRKVLELEQLL